MVLTESLESLNEGHASGRVPDDVVKGWLVLQTTSQVADNLARLAMGREITAQKRAAPHGKTEEVLSAWAARTGRSASLMDQYALTAKRVLAAIEEAGEAGQRLEQTVLHCQFDQVVAVVRETLDLPELKTRKRSSQEKTDQERVDAWVELAKSFYRDGVSADALMAGARALLVWLAAQLAGGGDEAEAEVADETELETELVLETERPAPEARIPAAVERSAPARAEAPERTRSRRHGRRDRTESE